MGGVLQKSPLWETQLSFQGAQGRAHKLQSALSSVGRPLRCPSDDGEWCDSSQYVTRMSVTTIINIVSFDRLSLRASPPRDDPDGLLQVLSLTHRTVPNA